MSKTANLIREKHEQQKQKQIEEQRMEEEQTFKKDTENDHQVSGIYFQFCPLIYNLHCNLEIVQID